MHHAKIVRLGRAAIDLRRPRPAVLAVTFKDRPARATGCDPIELTARTSINRRDFGMTAYSVVVRRTVMITIDARLMPG